MESYCATPPPPPPPLLYSAPQPLMAGLNPTFAITLVLLPFEFLFSNFSLISEKKKKKKKNLPAFWMDAFEFEHAIICIVKTGLKVLISEDILVFRQFLSHEIFWLLHL